MDGWSRWAGIVYVGCLEFVRKRGRRGGRCSSHCVSAEKGGGGRSQVSFSSFRVRCAGMRGAVFPPNFPRARQNALNSCPFVSRTYHGTGIAYRSLRVRTGFPRTTSHATPRPLLAARSLAADEDPLPPTRAAHTPPLDLSLIRIGWDSAIYPRSCALRHL